jgi:thioredoxin-like negative regulator of GroEL
MHTITSMSHFRQIETQYPAVLFYFSHEQCSVCKVLKPKIKELLENRFPQMPMFYCDTIEQPEVAAQNRIFAVPTLLVFFEGKETLRFSRNIGVGELEQAISRPYSMMF